MKVRGGVLSCTLVVSIINILLRVVARFISTYEYHCTTTSEELAQNFKMTYAMLLNIAIVIYVRKYKPMWWYLKDGLIDSLLYLLVVDAIGTRVCLIIDCTYSVNFFWRRRLGETKVSTLNFFRSAATQSGTIEDVQNVEDEIVSWRAAFEPEEFDSPDRYARALVTFLFCLFFAPVLPVAPCIGFIGLLFQYWMDKALILYWYKRSKSRDDAQATGSMETLKLFAPLLHIWAVYVFLSPSWQKPEHIFYLCLLMLPYGAVFVVVPPWGWSALFNCKRFFGMLYRKKSTARNHDYYIVQEQWTSSMRYHMDHPLYKHLSPEMNPVFLTPPEESAPDGEVLATTGSTTNYTILGRPD